MENKATNELIMTNQAALCTTLYTVPRLTPTGKVSHAKTRVYTQRYRKEWEQMPDFKGWLTSVPFQATRAFCTYCQKNLHAHRLSLLKHTCTMKHQRAALLHQNEITAKQIAAEKIAAIEAGYDSESEIHVVQKDSDHDGDEDGDEFEYVVERLEMEDEEIDDSHEKEGDEINDDEDDDRSMDMHESTDEDDPSPMKKVKIEVNNENCRDTLAEAMAHVHDEYLDVTEDDVNVQLEMVVSSEDGVQEIEHNSAIHVIDEDCGDSQNDDRAGLKRELRSSEDGDSSESETSTHKNSQSAYQNLKTMLTGMKRVRATVSSEKSPNSRSAVQYVLSDGKGSNLPWRLLVTDRKSGGQSEVTVDSKQATNNSAQELNTFTDVPGTSQQSSNQKSATKSTAACKKPCISTHVMDTSKGLPVGGLQVSLYKLMDGRWTFLNESNTSPNGRCNDLVDSKKCNFTAGRYKMHFDVDKYFTLRRIETMYPFIEIVFDVKNPTGDYHIPVLLSPFGYSTYRGSER